MKRSFLQSVKKWLFRAVCSILVVILLSAAVQRLRGDPVPMILGWGTAVVKTGSMEPAIPTGSLILIQATDEYEEGDIITYLDRYGIAVTHRIVEVDAETVTTQGDANNTKDRPFETGRIIGKVQFIIPGVGSVILPVLLSVTVLLAAVFAGGFIIKRKEQPQNA